MTKQIIAVGGGGFLCSSEPGIDRYILEQSSVRRPRIGFVPTASGDSGDHIVKFYRCFSQMECVPTHLEFFYRTPNLIDWTMSQDIIYVGGGNTKSMLAVWEAWNFSEILIKAMENGTILAGVSAGAICWFEYGITDSHAVLLSEIRGLGLLHGSCCPHYSSEKERKPAFERLIRTNSIPNGVAIDDGVALHYVDNVPTRVIIGSEGKNAYSINKTPDNSIIQSIINIETINVV